MVAAALLLPIVISGVARGNGVVLLGSEQQPELKEAIAAARGTAPELSFADLDSQDAAEQVRHAEVVLAVGGRALVMARALGPDKPIVYAMVPAAEAAPSKNVTGVALEVPVYAQFAVWKQLRFDGQRMGVLYDKQSSPSLAEAEKAARALGLTLSPRAVEDPAKLAGALAELGDSVDALWLAPDEKWAAPETARAVAAAARKRKVALLAPGGVAWLSPDATDIGRRAARMALAIAGRKERLPVPPPTSSTGALMLDATFAQELGIDLPETLLKKARKVYR